MIDTQGGLFFLLIRSSNNRDYNPNAYRIIEFLFQFVVYAIKNTVIEIENSLFNLLIYS